MKTATAPLPPLRSVKVLDQLRAHTLLALQFTNRTALCQLGSCHPFPACVTRQPLGSSEVEAFLSWLANECKVSVSTHVRALAALLFFYGKVLCTDLPWLQEIGRPRPSRRLPVVLTPDEVVRILGFLEGEHRLFAQLLCMERACGSVRVCNCGSRIWISITARSSCGRARAQGSGLDVTRELAPSPREQLSCARAWWLKDQAEAAAALRFPTPLSGSIRARAFLAVVLGFAQHTHSTDPRSGVVRRHHMYDQTFQRAFKRAVEQAGITKPATPHTSATRSRRPCSAAVTTFEPCRICSVIRRLYDDDLHACAEKLAVPECAHRLMRCRPH